MKKQLAILLFVAGCGGSNSSTASPGDDDVMPDAAVTLTPQSCKVTDDGDAPTVCTTHAAPNSFDPEVQWSWNGPDGETNSFVMPLVANLTDDNGDGAIDLCDTPDVVVVATAKTLAGAGQPAHIFLLDGKTGTQELRIATDVDDSVTPAIGDLDGDGVPEIVTTDATGKLVAFHHDGTLLFGPAGAWVNQPISGGRFAAAIALADLDGDGHVEILAGNNVFDDRGVLKWRATDVPEASFSTTTAADLDGDGKLEVVLGASAYRYDGKLLWNTGLTGGFVQIASFDSDPDPEILLASPKGISLIEHDGTIVYSERPPFQTASGSEIAPCATPGSCWVSPAAVGDFDGDGAAEFAVSSGKHNGTNPYIVQYTDQRSNASVVWTMPIEDTSGLASGTAFDFLGNGHTQTMYADDKHLFVFDDTGTPIFSIPRTSVTLTEYPIVVDVDNDGSAEIIVNSNKGGTTTSPTIQVIHDRQDRWVSTRRIWNEHAYHVTNVREDGTIPAHEKPSWQSFNTFRVNAQTESGGLCIPTVY